MRILTLDVGSSSIKAGYAKSGKFRRLAQVPVKSVFRGVQVEVPAGELAQSLEQAIREALDGRDKLDAIVLDTFCPGVVAVDKHGKVLAGCITHQDRRSEKQAREIEARIGHDRHLALAGNRPFPGGIGSTSLLWLRDEQPAVFRQIARIGQTSTWLIWHLTGQWMIDPSQAAFLGLYDTVGLSGWSDELCAAVGVKQEQLPVIKFANETMGQLAPAVAGRLGIKSGIPVLGGLVDTSAAVLATPMKAGQLVHSAGSTDVLALCLDAAHPADDLLTRPVGVAGTKPKFLAVSTIAAAGSAIKWMHVNMFADLNARKFRKLLAAATQNIATRDESADGPVFEPFMAGDRTSMEQIRASFGNLTLASRREDLLQAVVLALVTASAKRFERLQELHAILPEVYTMGGQSELADAMHAAWPPAKKPLNFQPIEGEAMRGLLKLAGEGADPACEVVGELR